MPAWQERNDPHTVRFGKEDDIESLGQPWLTRMLKAHSNLKRSCQPCGRHDPLCVEEDRLRGQVCGSRLPRSAGAASICLIEGKGRRAGKLTDFKTSRKVAWSKEQAEKNSAGQLLLYSGAVCGPMAPRKKVRLRFAGVDQGPRSRKWIFPRRRS